MISAGFLAGSAMKPYILPNISKVKGTVSNLKSVKSKDLSISTRDQLSFVKPQSREKEMFRRFPPALTTGRADGEVMMATGTRE